MSKKTKIIILPSAEYSVLNEKLADLTVFLITKGFVTGKGYGMGGPFGYGANFENDTFMMHKYCWCMENTCPWCSECTCEYTYYVDGAEVSFSEYIDFFNRETVGLELDEFNEKADAVNRRREKKLVHQCDNCKENLPKANFIHKSSGFEVHWYKWIGRGMHCNKEVTVEEITNIFNDCLKSLECNTQNP